MITEAKIAESCETIEKIRNSVPSTASSVNSKTSFQPWMGQKFGAITISANHPEDKFAQTVENE